ncbi:MAG: hypothetical protein PHQ65_07280 [Bacteroidales bacterium]|nr:hypothetical protein [Bacteroidales bacterium]
MINLLRKKRNKHILTVGSLFFITLILLYRSFLGFDWSDESFYLAMANRFYKGDIPFYDEWHLAQTYALMLLPLYSTFVKITGSTEGVYLFLRIITTLLFLVVSLLLYRTIFYHTKNYILSFFSAMTILVYSRASMPTLSYYSLSLLSYVLSIVAVFGVINNEHYSIIRSRVSFWIFGMCTAISVCSNPYTAVVFIIVMAVMLAFTVKNRLWFQRVIFSVLGCLTIAVPFLIYVLGKVSLNNIFTNLSLILHDPEHMEQPIFLNILRWFHEIFKKFGYLEISILGLFILYCFYKATRNKKISVQVKTGIMMASLLISISCLIKGSDMTGAAYVVISIVGFIAFLMSNKRNYAMLYSFFLPGIALSFVWKFGSNTGLTTMTIGFAVSAIAGIIWLVEFVNELKDEMDTNSYSRSKLLRILSISLVVSVLAQTMYLRVFFVHRDAPLRLLNTQIAEGPAKGLFTEKSKKLQYDEIIVALDQINRMTDKDDKVLISNLLPWCYLYLEARVGAHSTWRVPLNSEYAIEYYMQNAKMHPQIVFVLNPEYGVTNNDNSINGKLADYLKLSNAQKEEFKSGTVYYLENAR